MEKWSEMFKWMSIGFAGCGLVALIVILIGRVAMWFAEKVDKRPPQFCPCGKNPACFIAEHLGMCHQRGRLVFVTRGRLTSKPGFLWWLRSCAVLALLGSLIYFNGPWRGLLEFHPFLLAAGTLCWSLVASQLRDQKTNPASSDKSAGA